MKYKHKLYEYSTGGIIIGAVVGVAGAFVYDCCPPFSSYVNEVLGSCIELSRIPNLFSTEFTESLWGECVLGGSAGAAVGGLVGLAFGGISRILRRK